MAQTNSFADRGLMSTTAGARQQLGARLDQLTLEQPDLARALSLQRELLGREIDLLELLLRGGLPALALPAGYVAAKLRRGIPALHAEPVPLPSQLLARSLREFCDPLNSSATADAIARLTEILDAGHLDAHAVLSACFGRDQPRIRALAARHGVSADLMWLTAELALAPFAHLLSQQILQKAHSGADALAKALADWDRGYCPVCGSWPALIEAGADGHVLRCSFCSCGWQLRSYRCLYCANDGETFITAAANPEEPGRRLQLCDACGGYAKVLATATPTVFPLVAVEDLATMDLDMAAIERQYLRPALAEIKKGAR